MPADLLREPAVQAAPAETPAAPTPKPAAFDLGAAYEPLLKRYDAMLENLAKRQATILPQLEAAQTEATKAEQEAGRARSLSIKATEPYLRVAEAPRRPAPEPAPEPPVPQTRGRPFMSVDGQNALQGMVQSLSLMAQMALAGKAPVAALGALTGAMRGWTAGDQERAENQWRTYLGQVEQIRTQNREARNLWLDDMAWAGANTEAARARYVVSLAEAGQAERAAAAARMSMKDILDELHKVDTAATSLLGHSSTAIKAMADERLRETIQQSAEQYRQMVHQDLLAQREADRAERIRESDRNFAQRERHFAQRMQGDEQAFTPESLDFAAEQYYLTGVLPPMGMGKASTEARIKIINKAAEMARSAGTTGADIVARSQFARATQNALNQNMRQAAQLGSFIATAERNIVMARDLSAKVDRTGSPIFNKWYLWARGQGAGDADVTNFELINASVAAEFARVMNSATGGGVSTVDARKHANDLLSTAQTPEQYAQALTTIHQEIQNRNASFQDMTRTLQRGLKTGAPEKPSGQQPPRPGMIRARRKSDGAKGWLDPKDLGDLYELIEE